MYYICTTLVVAKLNYLASCNIMNKLKKLFSTPKKAPDDLRSLDEYEIYCSPSLTSSYSAEDPSSSSPSMQRGRHQLVIKLSDKEVCTQEIFVHQPPSLINEPIYDRTIRGLSGTWRLALDKQGEKIYTTNNTGCGAYSVFSLHEGKRELLKNVQCVYIWNIRGIAVDDSENVYLSGDHKIQKYDDEGQLVASFGWCEPGSAWYQCNDPNGLCCYDERVYVCDSRNQRVQVLSSNLEYLGCVGDVSYLVHPEDLEFDDKGRMHVLDSGKRAVVVFDSEGGHLYDVTFPEDEMLFPVSMRMIAGNYYVSDLNKSHIAVFATTGKLLHKILVQSKEEVMEDVDGFVHVDSSISQRPVGLAVDFDGYIYVSNIDSKEIQVF